MTVTGGTVSVPAPEITVALVAKAVAPPTRADMVHDA